MQCNKKKNFERNTHSSSVENKICSLDCIITRKLFKKNTIFGLCDSRTVNTPHEKTNPAFYVNQQFICQFISLRCLIVNQIDIKIHLKSIEVMVLLKCNDFIINWARLPFKNSFYVCFTTMQIVFNYAENVVLCFERCFFMEFCMQFSQTQF